MKYLKERHCKLFIRPWIKGIILVLSLFLCVFEQYAHAQQKPWQVHPRIAKNEWATLPEYLHLRIKALSTNPGHEEVGKNPKLKKYWKIMGPGYRYLHHVGYGFIHMNRLRLYNAQMSDLDKRRVLTSAVGEFDFVIKHMKRYGIDPKSLPVYFLIYVKKGEALLMLGEISKAMRAFTNAIKLKPNYYYSYLKLSECYVKIGDNKKAKEILEIGKKKAAKSRKNRKTKN